MASKTIKRRKLKRDADKDMATLIDTMRQVKERQDILMDGHAVLSMKMSELSLWQLIKNCFRRK